MAGRRTDGMPGWLVAAARTVRSSGRLSAASHRAVEGIAALLGQVAELQEQTQGFRPVLLLSVPAFAEVRAYGWPVELVVNEADWDFEQDWADHVTLRLAMMQTRYQA